MVIGVILVAVILVLADPAGAGVDWSRAGGDLFGAAVETHPSADSPIFDDAGAVPVLAPLSQPYGEAVSRAAKRHGLDPKLLHAVVIVESAYRARACSPAGACGLTQLMPATAADLGVADRFDPLQNLDGGADYLARQLLRFGDLRLALAAYNAGPARVARAGRIPRIPETQAYVVSVVECYLALSAGRGARHARDCRPAGDRP